MFHGVILRLLVKGEFFRPPAVHVYSGTFFAKATQRYDIMSLYSRGFGRSPGESLGQDNRNTATAAYEDRGQVQHMCPFAFVYGGISLSSFRTLLSVPGKVCRG